MLEEEERGKNTGGKVTWKVNIYLAGGVNARELLPAGKGERLTNPGG